MSIDIDWNAVTGGSDGLALAEAVRSFVHDKFQQVPLPRFIRAVQVHGFEFGSAAPLVELKDICDPLDDFYEEDESEDGYDTESSGNHSGNLRRTAREAGRLRSTITGWSGQNVHGGFHEPSSSNDHQDVHGEHEKRVRARGSSKSALPPYIDTRIPGLRSTLAPGEQLGSPLGPRSLTPTPGIPGGTSSLNYFHLPLSAGLSGTTTPLAAVAGAHFNNGGLEPPRARADSQSTLSAATPSISSVTPPSTADPTSRPISQHHEESDAAGSPSRAMQHDADEYERVPTPLQRIPRFRERSPQDIQIVAHVTYSGDIKMSLTAELLLDYPMESFVGIPLKLNITGLSFDGVAILAYIRRRAHFCFLSPEDADTLVGASHGTDESSACIDNDDSDDRAPRSAALDQRGSSAQRQHRLGGLLEQIHVESEIGDRENGKQVLKNVGKVEKFVLDEVRRIFDDEFVYPSFWTFLV